MVNEKIKLLYLQVIPNPSGVPYAYLRFKGVRHPVKSAAGDYLLPGDDQFLTAYRQLAIDVGATKVLRALPKRVPSTGSISKLIDTYKESGEFLQLSEGYQADKTYYLDLIDARHGPLPVGMMEREHALAARNEFKHTPGKANCLVKHYRTLINWGKDYKEFRIANGINPFDGIKNLKIGELDPWPDELFERAIEDADPMMRLAYFLFLYTGQRISDVVKMRRNVVKDDKIRVRQQKTKKWLWVPLHFKLREELLRAPKDSLFLICNRERQQFTEDAVRSRHITIMKNLMQHADAEGEMVTLYAEETGARYKVHGLRKNAVIALLQAGSSVHETAAVTGQSEEMVLYYARQIQQEALAHSAVARWEQAER